MPDGNNNDLRELLQALTPNVALPDVQGHHTATSGNGIDAEGAVLVYQPPDVIQHAGGITGDFLLRAGGTMLGPLELSRDPVDPLEAVTKRYADAAGIGGGPFLPLSGGQLSGPLLLAANPVQLLEAASRGYVDQSVGTRLSQVSHNVAMLGQGTGASLLTLNPASNAQIATGADTLQAISSAGLRSQLGADAAGLPTTAKTVVPALAELWGSAGNSVLRAGDTMTGALTLSGPPTQDLHASTKAYADTKLAKTGDTMQGILNMGNNRIFGLPTAVIGDEAASKQYVDETFSANTRYQGIYRPQLNQPDLITRVNQNADYFMILTVPPNIPEMPPPQVPGIGGTELNNGDQIIWSSIAASWQRIAAGALTVQAADARYLQLAGGALSGPVLSSSTLAINPGAPGSFPAQLAVGGQGISYAAYGASGSNIAFLLVADVLFVFQNGVNVGGGLATQSFVQANYLSEVQGDARYLQQGAADARYLQQAQADARYVNLAGDTMTGGVVFNGTNLRLAWGAGANPPWGSIYAWSDKPIRITQDSQNRQPQIANNDGSNARNIIDASGGAFTGGINFGSTTVTSPTDITRHLALWGGAAPNAPGFGFSVTAGTLNYVVNAVTNEHDFYTGANFVMRLTNAGLEMQGDRYVRGRNIARPYVTGANYAAGERVTWDNVTFNVTAAITNAPASPPFTSLRLTDQPQGAFYEGAISATNWASGNWIHLATLPAFGHYRMAIDGFETAGDTTVQLHIACAWNRATMAITAFARNPNGGAMWEAFRLSAVNGDGPFRLEAQIRNAGPNPRIKIHITGMNRNNNDNQTTVQKPPLALAGGANLGGTQYQLMAIPGGQPQTILGETHTGWLRVTGDSFATGYWLPGSRGTAGQVLTTDGNGNCNWGTAADVPPPIAELEQRVAALEARVAAVNAALRA